MSQKRNFQFETADTGQSFSCLVCALRLICPLTLRCFCIDAVTRRVSARERWFLIFSPARRLKCSSPGRFYERLSSAYVYIFFIRRRALWNYHLPKKSTGELIFGNNQSEIKRGNEIWRCWLTSVQEPHSDLWPRLFHARRLFEQPLDGQGVIIISPNNWRTKGKA